MTKKLPAPSDVEIERINAAGLAYAKLCVRYIHTLSVQKTGHSWFSKEMGHQLTRNALSQVAMHDPFGMDRVLTDAMAGWPDAHDALGGLIGEFNARGEKLPPQLATYDIHAWRTRLSDLGHRQRADNISRNMAWAVIIKALGDHFGTKPTRSRKSKQPPKCRTACSLLAQALKEELPANLCRPAERTIEGMWETIGPVMLHFATTLFRPEDIALPIPYLTRE
jgi:hypothetical protein